MRLSPTTGALHSQAPRVRIPYVPAGRAFNGMGVAPLVAIAIPAIISGVTSAIGLLMNRQGGAQKMAATQIVNELERQLATNRDGYLAQPVRTVSMQAAALRNFDEGWSLVIANCSDPALGRAGQACIEDRSPGGRWDWRSYYRDPIANDPDVQPDPSIVSSVGGAFSAVTSGFSPLLLAAALVAVAALTMQGGRAA